MSAAALREPRTATLTASRGSGDARHETGALRRHTPAAVPVSRPPRAESQTPKGWALVTAASPQLTDRELAALDLAADGLTIEQIAARLDISTTAAGARLDRAGRHLGTPRDRTLAIAAAYRCGIFTPCPERAIPQPALSGTLWAALPVLAAHASEKAMAAHLRISVGAARGRVIELRRAFGARNRVHLVRLAVDCGALTAPSLELGAVRTPPGWVAPEPTGPLTGHQARVLRLVASGMTDRQAGREMGISESAAGRLVMRAAENLGAISRPHAVFLACGLGILQPPAGELRTQGVSHA